MRSRLVNTSLALMMLFASGSANAAHGRNFPIYKIMGGGLLVAGALKLAGHCKYGLVDSSVTDPVTGISKPGKVCASAPSSGNDGSDYNASELKVVSKSVKKLDKNMAKNGEPRQKGCARHHIVPEFDDKIPENENIRQNFSSCGIDINDAINGVNPPYRDDAECKGARHGPLHTKEYYYAILRTITNGYANSGCDGTKNALREIKEDLINNRLNSNGYN